MVGTSTGIAPWRAKRVLIGPAWFLARGTNTVHPYRARFSHQEYLEALALHHAVIVCAMKAKQSAELATVEALDAAIAALAPMYTKH